MAPVREIALPPDTLLDRYRADGGHVDCYVADLPGQIDLARLIRAFYTSPAFRPERWLLGVLLGKRADDGAVARLAAGQTERFSAWSVEARGADQILLCDYQGKTRSWLMVKPLAGGTRLHFGSAVLPTKARAARLLFNALLCFHGAYSRALLGSAVRSLLRSL
ncbi:MAG TPA: hypothetical protein DER67_08630 [Novosphingobium sp.]|nr:hypothetical protein [Novosphingobium sp.]